MILAFDTSGPTCSVALATATGDIISCEERHVAKGHDQMLFLLLAEALKTASCRLEDVETLVAVVGPGSFTGLRIGLAAAQGLCFAHPLKNVGIRAFESQFFSKPNRAPGTYLTTIYTQTGQYYGLSFQEGKAISSPRILTPEQLLKSTDYIISDQPLPFLENSDIAYEITASHARTVIQAYLHGADQFPLIPLYLANPYATSSLTR